jgi:hypothetical protein
MVTFYWYEMDSRREASASTPEINRFFAKTCSRNIVSFSAKKDS